MKLQKYLARCGIASRRKSDALIREGRVSINSVVAQPGDSVDPEWDVITCDGKIVRAEKRIYLAFNKPRGVVTSTNDGEERQTVTDFLPDLDQRVFPVGRLARDIEGLVILTNDGELAHRLVQPVYEVDSLYAVWVDGLMPDNATEAFRSGVVLADGSSVWARVLILHRGVRTTLLRIALPESRRDKLRYACALLGCPVREMRRIGFGMIRLDDLQPGAWRHLSPDEVKELQKVVAL
jgi:23S rRNA pseudouridine2605 synthase